MVLRGSRVKLRRVKLARPLKRPFQWYKKVSNQHPYKVASITGLTILVAADYVCQKSLQKDKNHNWDYRRTLSLAAFGFFYYGFIAKGIYISYDKFLPCAKWKTIVEASIHTPFIFIPGFYFITCPIKGLTFRQTWDQMVNEWRVTAGGSVLFWAPAMFVNFAYASQAYRILILGSFSFFHKIGMSYYSNRTRHLERSGGLESPTIESKMTTTTTTSNVPSVMQEKVQDIIMNKLPDVIQKEVLPDVLTKNSQIEEYEYMSEYAIDLPIDLPIDLAMIDYSAFEQNTNVAVTEAVRTDNQYESNSRSISDHQHKF